MFSNSKNILDRLEVLEFTPKLRAIQISISFHATKLIFGNSGKLQNRYFNLYCLSVKIFCSNARVRKTLSRRKTAVNNNPLIHKHKTHTQNRYFQLFSKYCSSENFRLPLNDTLLVEHCTTQFMYSLYNFSPTSILTELFAATLTLEW